MNLIKTVFITFFILLCISCSSGDGSESDRLRADSLTNEVVNGRMNIAVLAKSDEFMYFNEKYFHEPADLKVIPTFDKVQIQVVTYRIYQHVKLHNNRYQFNVKKANELHIPNKAFVYYQRSFDEINRKAAGSKDSIRLELPNNYASMLINE